MGALPIYSAPLEQIQTDIKAHPWSASYGYRDSATHYVKDVKTRSNSSEAFLMESLNSHQSELQKKFLQLQEDTEALFHRLQALKQQKLDAVEKVHSSLRSLTEVHI